MLGNGEVEAVCLFRHNSGVQILSLPVRSSIFERLRNGCLSEHPLKLVADPFTPLTRFRNWRVNCLRACLSPYVPK